MMIVFQACCLTVASVGCSQTRSEQQLQTSRTVKITLKDGDFYGGETYLFLATCDASGEKLAGLSADWTDVTLDVSDLPDGQHIALVFQKDSEWGNDLVCLCKGRSKSIAIDTNGIAYAEGKTRMSGKGPYVVLTFHRRAEEKTTQVDPATVLLKVATASGRSLSTTIGKDGSLVIENVPREQISVRIGDISHQSEERKLFPYIRGASPEIIRYKLQDVEAGKALAKK